MIHMKKLRFLNFLLMSMLVVPSVWADITIEKFSEDRFGNVAQQRVLDDEGKFCALIKVKTDVQGLLVDATQVRQKKGSKQLQTVYLVEQQCEAHPDEVWIYLSSKTKRFRLFHPSFGGMKEGSAFVRNGYYYPDTDINPEITYQMQIKCDESSLPATQLSPTLPKLVEAQFNSDQNANMMYFDGGRVHPGQTYLVPAGDHDFVTKRLFYKTSRQKVDAIPGRPLSLSSSLSRIPVDVFAGPEVGKPSSYSDLAYGFRAGIICRWGVYVSYLSTVGYSADGDPVKPELLPYEPLTPFSDPHCQYDQWSVGLIYRCFSSLHVYAGIGQATRSVNWQGLDDKRHEHLADHKSGSAWEAGVLYNVNKFYLSAGADCLDGSFGGRVGVGIFLNILK